MKRRSLEQVAKVARVARIAPDWMIRRRRLERLAILLDHAQEPVRLFSTMECYGRNQRLALRQPCSPLAVAYADPVFRREGLAGDSVGEGVAFFRLSIREAHALLCDCRYGAAAWTPAVGMLVAERVRRLAAKWSVAEWRDRLIGRV